MRERYLAVMTVWTFAAAACDGRTNDAGAELSDLVELDEIAVLGQELFADVNLSLTRSTSCASCHNPEHAFVDARFNLLGSAVSVGDDQSSFGDRNAPTVTYAAFIPEFEAGRDGVVGGQFADGRAPTLEAQAGGPFINEFEMQMPDIEAVVERILENPDYVIRMKRLWGDDVFDRPQTAFDAVTTAISAFERTSLLSSFDSKFDKVQAGLAEFTQQEAQGRRLFRTERCAGCHSTQGVYPLFSNYEYENIGIPKNTSVRLTNGKGLAFTDHGLLGNPAIDDEREDGRFRVPTLRNVAVTAPYMHNGAFQELTTVVHFYNTRDVASEHNPETLEPWQASEVVSTRVAGRRIGDLGLSGAEEDALVAFLKTLTDERYEHLLVRP